MDIMTRERIRREGLPAKAHVVELVSDRSECELHPHFAGMECVAVSNIQVVSQRIPAQEPILIHCDRPERCNLAEQELSRMGYTNLFRYEGTLDDLKPFMAGWVAPERATAPGYAAPEAVVEAPFISREALEALLDDRGDAVHLFSIVADRSECPTMMVGVTCLEPGQLEEGLEGLNLDDTIVLRCGTGLDCQVMARRCFTAGFEDVRLFEGNYKDIRWTKRM